LSAAIALPLTAAIIAGAPAILDLFGREAIVAWWAVGILSFARAMETAGGQAAQIQQVISKFHRPLIGSAAGLAIAILTGAFAIPIWGVTGVAVAVAAGLSSSAIITIYQVDQDEKMHPFAAPFLTTFIRALGVSLLVVGVATVMMMAPRFVRLVLLIPVLLGGIWMSLKWALPDQDKGAFGKLKHKLRL
jgi:O-antigen/teichoic acid export membrane protein